METIESLSERLEALENRTRAVKRRLHCWRGIACGLVVFGLLSRALPSAEAQEELSAKVIRGLVQRIEALEYKLAHITSGPDDVTITGANLRIVNGLGDTATANGVGNLIVGYNEERGGGDDIRTGSHNVVAGRRHNFSSFGGLVVGDLNTISGMFASVCGGGDNTASGALSSVSGGGQNTASGETSWVSGGGSNTASGEAASVSAGSGNTASGGESSVSGGAGNAASGRFASVSGGFIRTAPDTFNWAAGPLFAAQ